MSFEIAQDTKSHLLTALDELSVALLVVSHGYSGPERPLACLATFATQYSLEAGSVLAVSSADAALEHVEGRYFFDLFVAENVLDLVLRVVRDDDFDDQAVLADNDLSNLERRTMLVHTELDEGTTELLFERGSERLFALGLENLLVLVEANAEGDGSTIAGLGGRAGGQRRHGSC